MNWEKRGEGGGNIKDERYAEKMLGEERELGLWISCPSSSYEQPSLGQRGHLISPVGWP